MNEIVIDFAATWYLGNEVAVSLDRTDDETRPQSEIFTVTRSPSLPNSDIPIDKFLTTTSRELFFAAMDPAYQNKSK